MEVFTLGSTVLGNRFWIGLGVYTLRVWGNDSGHQFWISQTTHWTRVLHFGGLHSRGLQSRATDFGSRNPLIGLKDYTLGG